MENCFLKQRESLPVSSALLWQSSGSPRPLILIYTRLNRFYDSDLHASKLILPYLADSPWNKRKTYCLSHTFLIHPHPHHLFICRHLLPFNRCLNLIYEKAGDSRLTILHPEVMIFFFLYSWEQKPKIRTWAQEAIIALITPPASHSLAELWDLL